MSRRWFALLGAFLVLSMLGLVVAFGRPRDPLTVVQLAGWLLAGVLFVAGALVPAASGVEWYRLVGVADVLMGLAFAAPLADALLGGGPVEAETLFYGLVTFVGGLTLAFIGVDWFRGGRHFDLSRLESGTAADS